MPRTTKGTRRGSRRGEARETPAFDPGNAPETYPEGLPGEAPNPGGSVVVFESMADDSYVIVHRLDPGSKRWVMHGRLAPHEATEELVQERWGGGFWRLQERLRDASGSWIIGRTAHREISGPYRAPTEPAVVSERDRKADAAPVVGTAPSGGGRIDDIIGAGLLQLFQMQSQSMKSQMETTQAMIALARQPSGPAMDWPALIVALAPVLTKLVGGESKQETLEMMRTMADLFAKSTAKAGGVNEIISGMRDLLEVKDMLSPGGGESPDPLMSSIPRLVEVIAEQSQAAKGGKAAPRPAVGPGAAAQPDVPPNINEFPVWQQVLLRNKRTILSMAMMGQDAGFVAEMAQRLMPPQWQGAIMEFVHQPDAAQLAVGVIPELANYPTWTAEFFVALRDLMLGDGEDEGEDEDEEEQMAPPPGGMG